MNEITKCLCFYERKPNIEKIEMAKTLINQYKATNTQFADKYKITNEAELIDIQFENPTPEFIKALKDLYDIDLSTCLKG